MQTWVVSLPRSQERRAEFARLAPPGLDWRFFDAADGHRPEDLDIAFRGFVPEMFWKGERIKPGVFGCFLSHVLLWQKIPEADRPFMVLEDDAEFCDPAGTQPDLSAKNWELLLVNQRMGNWRRRVEKDEAACDAAALPGLMHKAARTETSLPGGPGTDGYVLRPSGAKKLIEAAGRFGFRVGVDWFLIARSAPQDLLLALCPFRMPEILADPEPSLRCSISAAPLVPVSPIGAESAIRHGQREALESYRRRVGTGSAGHPRRDSPPAS